MDWINSMQAAVRYIETNLDGDLSTKTLARLSFTSESELQRAFSLICGMPLGEYIRNRRMTVAGEEIAQGERVLDVALKYGYDSPDSFSRAFQRFHGVLPSQVKGDRRRLKVFTPITDFTVKITGAEYASYEEVEKEMKPTDTRTVKPGFYTEIPTPFLELYQEGKCLCQSIWEDRSEAQIYRMKNGSIYSAIITDFLDEYDPGYQYLAAVLAESGSDIDCYLCMTKDAGFEAGAQFFKVRLCQSRKGNLDACGIMLGSRNEEDGFWVRPMSAWLSEKTVRDIQAYTPVLDLPESLAELQAITDLTRLIMPEAPNRQYVWAICAQVLALKSDEELRPYLPRLLNWFRDFELPGAWTIIERLAEMPLSMQEEAILEIIPLQAPWRQDARNRWGYTLHEYWRYLCQKEAGTADCDVKTAILRRVCTAE